MIVDGLTPNKRRNEIALRSSIGLGCVVRPKIILEKKISIVEKLVFMKLEIQFHL